MIRKSGVRPAVKRWKLSWLTPRRWASGHIAATQLPKLAAACRIAEAVISGWPEAPSSPLQGGGAPSGPGVACGAGPDLGPEKILPRKFEIPSLPADWAWDGLIKAAGPEHNSAAAIRIAPVRLLIARSIRPMPCPSVATNPRGRRPCHGFQ